MATVLDVTSAPGRKFPIFRKLVMIVKFAFCGLLRIILTEESAREAFPLRFLAQAALRTMLRTRADVQRASFGGLLTKARRNERRSLCISETYAFSRFSAVMRPFPMPTMSVPARHGVAE